MTELTDRRPGDETELTDRRPGDEIDTLADQHSACHSRTLQPDVKLDQYITSKGGWRVYFTSASSRVVTT